MDTFKPFILDGLVSLSNDQSNAYIPIKILRDAAGASQLLILTKTLPFSESSYSGTNVLIRGVNSKDYRSIPLHNLKLQSDFVTGDVSLDIIDSLPFDGIHLLLGNDLAGDKVKINPIVTNKPCLTQQPDPVEQLIQDLYLSCAVTRTMKKRQELEHKIDDVQADETGVSDTFLSKIFENLTKAAENDTSNKKNTFSKPKLIKEQQNDPEISALYQKTADEIDAAGDPVCYYSAWS